MNKEIALKNLADVVAVLNEGGGKWWIDAGTCLGAIREKDFIPHDNDIDIGILDAPEPYKLAKGMIKKGFVFKSIFGQKGNGFEFAFTREGEKIDFFFYDRSTGQASMSIWKGKEQIILDFPNTLFRRLKKIKFLGLDVFVPSPPEKYLTIRYGDWREVVKEWDWVYGAKNTRK